MAQAKNLQQRYTYIGAAKTQNVRNPLPMHQLVLEVLPSLPVPTAIVDTKIRTKLTIAGRQFVKQVNAKSFAKDVLPPDFWKKNAVTAQEIVENLQSRGFIANIGSVRNALQGQAKSMRFNRDEDNKSYSRYFIEASK